MAVAFSLKLSLWPVLTSGVLWRNLAGMGFGAELFRGMSDAPCGVATGNEPSEPGGGIF